MSEIMRNYGISSKKCPKLLETIELTPKVSEIIKTYEDNALRCLWRLKVSQITEECRYIVNNELWVTMYKTTSYELDKLVELYN